jgi:hypothetical protein
MPRTPQASRCFAVLLARIDDIPEVEEREAHPAEHLAAPEGLTCGDAMAFAVLLGDDAASFGLEHGAIPGASAPAALSRASPAATLPLRRETRRCPASLRGFARPRRVVSGRWERGVTRVALDCTPFSPSAARVL